MRIIGILLACVFSVSALAQSVSRTELRATNTALLTNINARLATNSGTAFNLTTRATSATAVADTLAPYVGGTADWVRWLGTNGVKSSYINSNGVWFFGLDANFNNGIAVSGQSTLTEVTANGAALFGDTVTISGAVDINNSVDIQNGLTVGGLVDLAELSLNGSLTIDGLNSNAAPVSLLGRLADGEIVETLIPVGGGGSDFYGQNTTTNLLVANTASGNTFMTWSNSAATGSVVLGFKFTGVSGLPFDIVVNTNQFYIESLSSSEPIFFSYQRTTRSLTLGSPTTGVSLNSITNNANVYNKSNVVTAGSSTATSFETFGDGSDVGRTEYFSTNGNDVIAFGANPTAVGTNFFRVDIGLGGMTAGQVLQVYSRTVFGPTNFIVLTNVTPSTGTFSYDIDSINGFTNTTLTTLSTNALPTNVMALVTVRAVAGGATNYASYHQGYTFQRITTGTVIFRGSNDIATPVESIPILNFYVRTNGNNIEAVYQGQTNEPMKWRVQGTILYVTNDGPYTASGGSGASFSDDFNRADSDSPGASWTEVVTDIDIASSALSVSQSFDSTDHIAIHNTSSGTVEQYVKVTSTFGGISSPQIFFRYTDSSSPFYAIEIDNLNNILHWFHWTAVGGTKTEVDSTAFTQTSGNILGFTISGTGTSTVVKLWDGVTADAPSNMSTWDGAGSTKTLSADPASAVDTGTKLGIGGRNNNSTLVFDNFFAGGL